MTAYIGDTTIYDGDAATGNVVTTTLPTDHGALSGLIDNDHLRYVGGPWYNVQVYGATGNGTTDDTAAIQAAWTALLANGRGVLYFPQGTYLTTGLVLQGGSNFLIQGERASHIWIMGPSAADPYRATHNVVTIADCTDFTVSGLVFDGRRDTIVPNVLLAANTTSGQPNVTVTDASTFAIGEMVQVFGGLTISGGAEKDRNDPFIHIINIVGNVLTLESNLANSYTAGAGGAYVTRYQTGDSNHYTAAGRTLGNEDAQNGLHLLSCARFQIVGCAAQNVWESPIKTGTGFQTASTATDGCTDGTIANNVCYHGYDQGVSVWNSQRISVTGNVCRDAGWGGVVFTHSEDCVATGNVCSAQTYRVPGDTAAGSGLAVEGCERVVLNGNVSEGNYSNGIRLGISPMFSGFNLATTLTNSPAAGATSFTVASTTNIHVGMGYTLTAVSDPAKRENVRIASIVGSTLNLVEPLRLSWSSGDAFSSRHNLGVEVIGNTCSHNVTGAGIEARYCQGVRIGGNDCSGNGVGVDTPSTYGILVTTASHGTIVDGNSCIRNSQEGILVDGLLGIKLLNNTIIMNGTSGAIKNGIKVFGLVEGEISGNLIERHGDNGIQLVPGGGRNTGRSLIGRNTCRYNSHRGIIAEQGTASDLMVYDNICMYNGEPGIELRGTSNSVIRGNTCANQGGQEGIRLDDFSGNACTKNIIIDNLLYDDRGGSAQQNFGLRELGATANSQVAYNRAYGNTSGQLSLAGSSTSTGNIIA